MISPYAQGWYSALQGEDPRLNPFEKLSKEANEWNLGFNKITKVLELQEMEKAEKDAVIFNNQIEREFNNWNVRDDLKDKTLEEIKAAQPKYGFAVAAYNIEKGLNIGTMMRTAVSFGADEFIIFGDKKWDKRSTVGAQNYIKVTKESTENLVKYLEQEGYFLVAVEQGGNDTTHEISVFDQDEPELRPCFIFGSESQGLPKEILDRCDFIISIKTFGVLRSLNVSTACAIVLNNYMNLE